MGSNSGRKSGSSGRSTRKRVVIGAEETTRVRYDKNQPRVESERHSTARQQKKVASKRAGIDGRPAQRAGKRMANTKRDARQRRQQKIAVRRGGVVAAIVAAVLLVVWGLIALYNAPILPIRQVEVEGNRHLTDEQVRALARIPAASTLVRLPRAAIENRIARDPWVESVEVQRDLPSTVRIVVGERTPGAIIDAGGARLWVVSSDGVWLSERSTEETGLVVVRDVDNVEPAAGKASRRAEISNALRIISGLSDELRGQLRVISAPSVEQTALITESDVEIFFGEADRVEDKDRVAREILTREKGKVVYINVRVPDRPTWRGL